MKRSWGRSGLSCRALAGQALTQLRHRVQASAFTTTLPSGAAAGKAMVRPSVAACVCNLPGACCTR